jgi:hypothetical protein
VAAVPKVPPHKFKEETASKQWQVRAACVDRYTNIIKYYEKTSGEPKEN